VKEAGKMLANDFFGAIAFDTFCPGVPGVTIPFGLKM
jgi:hypothetical protein